jgi:O-antigen ligase
LLPWSTSGVVIFIVLWIVALIPTLEPRAFVRQMRKPIYFTPVALSVLALVGAFWSDAPWDARLHAVGPTTKLFVLPLLLFHFARTARGVWVLIAFLISRALLMLASWIVGFVPTLTLKW